MGFGLIFVGYVTLLFFKVVPIGIIGTLLMYRGLAKLCPYSKNFEYARNTSAVFFVYFALFGCAWFANVFGLSNLISNTVFMYVDEISYYTILLVFHIFLYRALGDISASVGYEKGVGKKRRCQGCMIVFLIMTAIRLILTVFGIELYLRVALVFFELFWMVLTASFIYSCYMMIATQDIIDDEHKKMLAYDEKYSLRKKKSPRK